MPRRDISKATRVALEALALDAIEGRDLTASLAWLDTQTLRPDAEAKAEARQALLRVQMRFPEAAPAVDAALAAIDPPPDLARGDGEAQVSAGPGR